jgi:hypothetical protein
VGMVITPHMAAEPLHHKVGAGGTVSRFVLSAGKPLFIAGEMVETFS